jgi:hypothetical protein
MKLDPKEKCRLEYAEVGHLRRYYSTVRSGLTTFCMTVSLAAFASYFSQPARPRYPVFIGFFMPGVAVLACLVFLYRCEKANLYMALLWHWFDAEAQEGPASFYQHSPARGTVLREMCCDEMNWAMVVGALLIAGSFYIYT